MRWLFIAFLSFGFCSTTSAFFDGNVDLSNLYIPNYQSERPDRDIVRQILEYDQAKLACAPPVDAAGIPLLANLDITATKLPIGMERFRLRISVCDTAQNCYRAYNSEFQAASVGRNVSRVWVIQYGCPVKFPNVIAGFQLELIQDLAWYKRDFSIDVGYVPLDLLLQAPQTLSTRARKAEFKIELKSN